MTVLASYDSGATFTDTLGVAHWPDTTLSWPVPEGEYPHCLIGVEVTDRGYNTAFDTSDSTFAIVRDLSGVEGDAARSAFAIGSECNPFTGSTRIFFTVAASTRVRLGIYDVEGRLVRMLVDGETTAGYHTRTWDGSSPSGARAAPGVYFAHIVTAYGRRTAKVILMR
jgi:hypothetical protein